MRIEVLADAESVAQEAAARIAVQARASVAARGRFIMAVSGGQTPWMMLRALSTQDVPWDRVHVFQVDERVAPVGHPDRNLTHLRESLRAYESVLNDRLYAMPVDASDLEAAAAQYTVTLQAIAGSPPVLDLVHLGLGSDGHTASLVPGDAVLDVTDRDVALTGIYQGRRRMTVTAPLLNRARFVLWLVTGHDKHDILTRLRAGDRSIPAGGIRREHAVVLADRAAAGVPGIREHEISP